jgi:putative transposase
VETSEATGLEGATLKKSRFTDTQIVGILKEHEAGAATKDLRRRIGICPATFYAWKAKVGGLEVSDLAKMKTLEDENRRLNVSPVAYERRMAKQLIVQPKLVNQTGSSRVWTLYAASDFCEAHEPTFRRFDLVQILGEA